MKKQILYLILMTGFSLLACRKDLPIPPNGEVEFSVSGQLDGRTWQLEAGIDEYFLDTDHSIDQEGVREFWGHFRPLNCKDCRENLKIVIRDYRANVSNDPVELDSVFKDQFYLYRGEVEEPDARTFRFRGHSGGIPPFEYAWDFGDGSVSNEAEPKHQFIEDSAYVVNLRIKDANGCWDESRNEVNTGNRFNNCDLAFVPNSMGGGQVNFAIDHPNPAQEFPLVFWDFGDGSIAQGDYAPSHSYSLPGIYEVKMILFSPNGQYCCDIKNIFTEPAPSCASHIAFRSANPTPELRRIYIEYTDVLGQRFTTDYFEGQPEESFFELLNWDLYKNDHDGQKTIKLDVQFQCRLFQNENESNFIDLNGAKARFAVAYPE